MASSTGRAGEATARAQGTQGTQGAVRVQGMVKARPCQDQPLDLVATGQSVEEMLWLSFSYENMKCDESQVGMHMGRTGTLIDYCDR